MGQVCGNLEEFLESLCIHLVAHQCQQNRQRKCDGNGVQTDDQCIDNGIAKHVGIEVALEVLQTNPVTAPDALRRAEVLEGYGHTIHGQIGKTEKDPIPDVIGYGHLHTPNLYRYGNKTIFNVGSVGAPVEMMNSGEENLKSKFSTMSSYLIIEGELGALNLSSISFNFVRIPYDIEKEIKYLEESDMPNKEVIIKSLRTANH